MASVCVRLLDAVIGTLLDAEKKMMDIPFDLLKTRKNFPVHFHIDDFPQDQIGLYLGFEYYLYVRMFR